LRLRRIANPGESSTDELASTERSST
jgi:hypothetical protein